jgi:hypothetical protein
LELPVTFALKRVLGLPHPAEMPEVGDFELWFRVILRAKDRDTLFQGMVRRPLLGRNRRQGFDPQIVRRQQDKGETAHVERLKVVASKREPPPSPETWAGEMAAVLGFDLTANRKHEFAKRLEAAYRYDVFLWKAAANPKAAYDFNNHPNDWIDGQQLFYLSDPDVHLMVHDKGFFHHGNLGSQASQILRLRDYLTQNGLSL